MDIFAGSLPFKLSEADLKKLFEQFSSSFSQTDELILVDIYSSLREQKDSSVSSSFSGKAAHV